MAITEEQPTAGECPRATSLQRIHQRSSYSPGHAQLCVCRRPCCHYTEHRLCPNRGNTDSSSMRTDGVLHHKPASCESDKDARQPLPCTYGIANVTNSSTSAGTVNLTHCNLPVYIGVTLDRTLSYKAHIEKTKKKVGTRNNIIRKLRNSKWGATPPTFWSSDLALCYSSTEYACPVWECSTHAKKLDATLNETCRMCGH